MAAATGVFRRRERLRKSRDYQRLNREGRREASRNFVMLRAAGSEHSLGLPPRLGLTVSRKVGPAVTRNYVKRCTREWFRRGRQQLQPGDEIVVIARKSAGKLSGVKITQELTALLERQLSAGRGRDT